MPAACPAISVAAPEFDPVKVWRTACQAAVIAARRATPSAAVTRQPGPAAVRQLGGASVDVGDVGGGMRSAAATGARRALPLNHEQAALGGEGAGDAGPTVGDDCAGGAEAIEHEQTTLRVFHAQVAPWKRSNIAPAPAGSWQMKESATTTVAASCARMCRLLAKRDCGNRMKGSGRNSTKLPAAASISTSARAAAIHAVDDRRGLGRDVGRGSFLGHDMLAQAIVAGRCRRRRTASRWSPCPRDRPRS